MKTSYDRTIDSLYVELRPLPAERTVEVEEDVLLDLGKEGEPVGYDIQHASQRKELIAWLIFEQCPTAVERCSASWRNKELVYINQEVHLPICTGAS